MRVVFMGTPEFAVPALQALLAAGHAVVAAYSQPPRPAGRGMAERPSPVHAAAAAAGIPVLTPRSLRDPTAQAAFAAHAADAAVVAAYGLILPEPVLAAPRLGCWNIHASLLPRWRGAAPIHRAILAGDAETGVAIMRMERGLDTGPVAIVERTPIGPGDTTGSLHDRLAAIGARLIVAALDGATRGDLAVVPQPADGVTYAAKIDKAEARLDWRKPAAALERKVRALQPVPGAWFAHGGTRFKVIAAVCEPTRSRAASPGLVLDDHLAIACGEGALRPTRLQREGRGALAASEVLRGAPIPAGTQLDVDGQ
ncbi:MAG: methionyl-tRNA formyltransferase [Alphaproteobacteria bacterium]|nr:methionyl-tRNA formyltransferase [Alphaproteobacteria bacterium]